MKNKIAFVIAVVAISFGCNFKKKTTSTTTGTTETRPPGSLILVKEVVYPRVIVNDDTIFWTEGDVVGSQAKIHSMPADGSEHPVTDLITKIPAPTALTLDATHLYWVGGTNVMRMNLDGSSPATLSDQCRAQSPIAVDAQNVFFNGPNDIVIRHSSIVSMPLAGGELTVRHLFGDHFAIDDKYLYVANDADLMHRILASPREGGEPVVISDIAPDATVIAADDANLYYTQNGVMKFSKTDMTKTKLATTVGAVTFLHVDGDFLYYVDSGGVGTGHSILKVPIAGGEPVTLATKISEVSSLTTDEQSLYWGVLDRVHGSITRLTPK